MLCKVYVVSMLQHRITTYTKIHKSMKVDSKYDDSPYFSMLSSCMKEDTLSKIFCNATAFSYSMQKVQQATQHICNFISQCMGGSKKPPGRYYSYHSVITTRQMLAVSWGEPEAAL